MGAQRLVWRGRRARGGGGGAWRSGGGRGGAAPSAGLPTVHWSLLLAMAALVGYLIQRHTGLPKVVGYSLVGTLAGLAGFGGAVWPLQGIGLFLLELGAAIVLFECGARIPLRWFRH